MAPISLALGAFSVGVASHVFYFSRGEHHMQGPFYIRSFAIGSVAEVLAYQTLRGSPLLEDLGDPVSLLLYSLAGLYTSLIIYRIFFHPLSSFEGPLGAKITSLWLPTQLTKLNAHTKFEQYHESYGNFVRVGSSDLSIADPRAINIIYGPGTSCIKGDWYDQGRPLISLQTTREKSVHDQRRRVWSAAFSDKALREYDARTAQYRQQLLEHLQALHGGSVNVTNSFHLFSFDAMGDLAFGAQFNMLKTTKEHWAIKLLKASMEALGLMLPSWFFRIATAIPGLTKEWWQFIDYCCDRLADRMGRTPEMADVMSSLLEGHKKDPPSKTELKMLQGDSQLVIVAGSDTTATTLTALFYELCKKPELMEELRAEILSSLDGSGDFDHTKMQHLKLLNAVINETLRLWPPVPVHLQRMTPPEGIMVGKKFIPGNVSVFCPQYVLGRSEKCFVDPLEFIPQRWYPDSGLIKDKSGFAPFSTGSYNCIGKPLALMTIRMVVANLLLNFDVAFAPGETGAEMISKATTNFTLAMGPLELVFKERQLEKAD